MDSPALRSPQSPPVGRAAVSSLGQGSRSLTGFGLFPVPVLPIHLLTSPPSLPENASHPARIASKVRALCGVAPLRVLFVSRGAYLPVHRHLLFASRISLSPLRRLFCEDRGHFCHAHSSVS